MPPKSGVWEPMRRIYPPLLPRAFTAHSISLFTINTPHPVLLPHTYSPPKPSSPASSHY
uniref:Uncharacterized protein n=1 Tax=Arundo donax TaxID=35708 RepID=A0A0A9DLP1_ARUDO